MSHSEMDTFHHMEDVPERSTEVLHPTLNKVVNMCVSFFFQLLISAWFFYTSECLQEKKGNQTELELVKKTQNKTK